MPTHLGVTGTREGMTDAQLAHFARLATRYDWVHHGDCVGADAQCHDIAVELGKLIHVHPPKDPKFRAYKVGALMDVPTAYLMRDRAIVYASSYVVAYPKQETGEHGGGTWYTINYARKVGKFLAIVRPSGTVEYVRIPTS